MWKNLLEIFNFGRKKPKLKEQPCLSKKAPAKKPSVKTSQPKSKVAVRSSKVLPLRTLLKGKPAKAKAKSK
jgi:hypothetical protein